MLDVEKTDTGVSLVIKMEDEAGELPSEDGDRPDQSRDLLRNHVSGDLA